MNTSSFLAALRAQASLPLVFRRGRESVSAAYHLTEIKRVAYETMDCGAMTHRWSETHFELWVPAAERLDAGRVPMSATKFLRIVARVESELPLAGDTPARVLARFADEPAALHDVEDVSVQDGALVVSLLPDRTRCKAAERRLAELAAAGEVPSSPREEEQAGAGCGCSPRRSDGATAVCCA